MTIKEIEEKYPLLAPYYDMYNGNFQMDEKFVNEHMDVIKDWLRNNVDYFLVFITEAYNENDSDEENFCWILTNWWE